MRKLFEKVLNYFGFVLCEEVSPDGSKKYSIISLKKFLSIIHDGMKKKDLFKITSGDITKYMSDKANK